MTDTRAVVIYHTKSGTTASIAEAIQAGLKESGIEAELLTIDEVDIPSLSAYSAVILGAPTYHKDIQEKMKMFLKRIDPQSMKGKIGAAFGAYGWSGEGHEILTQTMTDTYGMQMVLPGVKLTGNAGAASLSQHRDFGRRIAARIKEGQ